MTSIDFAKYKAEIDKIEGSTFTRRMLEIIDDSARKNIIKLYIALLNYKNQPSEKAPSKKITISNHAVLGKSFKEIVAEFKMPTADQVEKGRPPILEISAVLKSKGSYGVHIRDYTVIYRTVDELPEIYKASLSKMPLTNIIDFEMFKDLTVASKDTSGMYGHFLALRLSPQEYAPVGLLRNINDNEKSLSPADFYASLKERGITNIDTALVRSFDRVDDLNGLLARFDTRRNSDFTDLVTAKNADAIFRIVSMGKDKKDQLGLSYVNSCMNFCGKQMSWSGLFSNLPKFEKGLFSYIKIPSGVKNRPSSYEHPRAIDDIISEKKTELTLAA